MNLEKDYFNCLFIISDMLVILIVILISLSIYVSDTSNTVHFTDQQLYTALHKKGYDTQLATIASKRKEFHPILGDRFFIMLKDTTGKKQEYELVTSPWNDFVSQIAENYKEDSYKVYDLYQTGQSYSFIVNTTGHSMLGNIKPDANINYDKLEGR